MTLRVYALGLTFAGWMGLAACSSIPDPPSSPPSPYVMSGPLVSSRTTMVTAWFIPKSPLTDPSLDKSTLSNQIRWGFRIFTDTPHEAPQFAPGKMSCNNCHLNGGQRERSLPLVAVAGMFPEYNRRSGRLYSLGDRIVDCFLRSENATEARKEDLPTTTSKQSVVGRAVAGGNMTSGNATAAGGGNMTSGNATAAGGGNMTQPLVPPKQPT